MCVMFNIIGGIESKVFFGICLFLICVYVVFFVFNIFVDNVVFIFGVFDG